MTNMVHWTHPAGVVPHLGREEAEARHQYYIGPEHLLVGLLRQREFLREVDSLRQDDDAAADLLIAHGLDLATVRAGIDRLVAQGALPRPQLSDGELLATLGIDLDAVHDRLKEEFGWQAWYDAAQWLRLRPVQPLPHAPGGGTPLTCHRVLVAACEEAAARGAEVGPLHLLLGLLRDAERPVGEGLTPGELRLRSMLGLPNSGPSPVRLLVEAEGLTLEGLQAATRAELDGPGGDLRSGWPGG
jgi:Clp amino terminal domain, pathogenicity island component